MDGRTPLNILVTGSTGFVGSAVCANLHRQGHRVVAVTRRVAPELSPYQTMLIDEMGPNSDWSNALRGIDVVVHLAARVHLVRDTASDPMVEYRRSNVDLTLSLARQAAHAGVKRFVFISSVKVNGESTCPGAPFTEQDAPRPTDPYGISKAEAERGLQKLALETGMEVVIVRPPLVYGPGVKANFRSLIRSVKNRVPLPLGAIHNQRSLVGLENLVDFIALCCVHPAAANETFLVSDGHDISTPDLVRSIAAACGTQVLLVRLPVRFLHVLGRLAGKSAAVQRLCGNLQINTEKARRLLGWTPSINSSRVTPNREGAP